MTSPRTVTQPPYEPSQGPGPAPEGLLDSKGHVRYGVFSTPFKRVDIEDASFPWRGLPVPAQLRRLRLKEWQHVALVHPEALLSLAIVDAKYLQTGWCQFVDRRGGLRLEHHRRGIRQDVRLARALWDDHSHFEAPGFSLHLRNHLNARRHVLSIDMAADGDLPAMSGRITLHHDLDATQPLVVSLPVGSGRAMYSHKVVVPVEGQLEVGRRSLTLSPDDSFALLDVHKAHYPHHTFWRWATFATRAADGRLVGLNLTKNVVPDGPLHENAVWLDGQLHHLAPARFEVDPDDPAGKPWRLSTDDGSVELTFTPHGERTERLDLGLIRSMFHQCYGTFSGTVRVGGETIAIDDAYGLAEDHDSRW